MPKQAALKRYHTPIRSCVVCRQTSDKRTLLRVVRLPEKAGGGVVVDPTGKKSGRGAYICAQHSCIDLVQKQRRFERSLAVQQADLAPGLFEQLKQLAAAQPSRAASAVEPLSSELEASENC